MNGKAWNTRNRAKCAEVFAFAHSTYVVLDILQGFWIHRIACLVGSAMLSPVRSSVPDFHYMELFAHLSASLVGSHPVLNTDCLLLELSLFLFPSTHQFSHLGLEKDESLFLQLPDTKQCTPSEH